jgi:hypothetical protein
MAKSNKNPKKHGGGGKGHGPKKEKPSHPKQSKGKNKIKDQLDLGDHADQAPDIIDVLGDIGAAPDKEPIDPHAARDNEGKVPHPPYKQLKHTAALQVAIRKMDRFIDLAEATITDLEAEQDFDSPGRLTPKNFKDPKVSSWWSWIQRRKDPIISRRSDEPSGKLFTDRVRRYTRNVRIAAGSASFLTIAGCTALAVATHGAAIPLIVAAGVGSTAYAGGVGAAVGAPDIAEHAAKATTYYNFCPLIVSKYQEKRVNKWLLAHKSNVSAWRRQCVNLLDDIRLLGQAVRDINVNKDRWDEYPVLDALQLSNDIIRPEMISTKNVIDTFNSLLSVFCDLVSKPPQYEENQQVSDILTKGAGKIAQEGHLMRDDKKAYAYQQVENLKVELGPHTCGFDLDDPACVHTARYRIRNIVKLALGEEHSDLFRDLEKYFWTPNDRDLDHAVYMKHEGLLSRVRQVTAPEQC